MTRRAFPDDQMSAIADDYRAGATYRELAVKYGGGSNVTVRRALISYGVPSRTPAQSRALRRGPIDEEELVRLYREDHWNIAPLARHFKIKNQAVTAILRAHDVDLRPGGTVHSAFDTTDKCEALAAEYRESGNVHTLADRHDCTAPTIIAALRRVGQKSIAPGREGEFSAQHAETRHGPGALYGNDWAKTRRDVFDRDDNACRNCGHPEHDVTRKMEVAHLVPLEACETREQANVLENLVTLCRTCHRAFDGDYSTEWNYRLNDRRIWPAWSGRVRACADCGSRNVVSVPLAGPVS